MLNAEEFIENEAYIHEDRQHSQTGQSDENGEIFYEDEE